MLWETTTETIALTNSGQTFFFVVCLRKCARDCDSKYKVYFYRPH